MKCELCGKEEAHSISANRHGEWKFTGHCNPIDDVGIPLGEFFYEVPIEELGIRDTRNMWIDHLRLKAWFIEDLFNKKLNRLLES